MTEFLFKNRFLEFLSIADLIAIVIISLLGCFVISVWALLLSGIYGFISGKLANKYSR